MSSCCLYEAVLSFVRAPWRRPELIVHSELVSVRTGNWTHRSMAVFLFLQALPVSVSALVSERWWGVFLDFTSRVAGCSGFWGLNGARCRVAVWGLVCGRRLHRSSCVSVFSRSLQRLSGFLRRKRIKLKCRMCFRALTGFMFLLTDEDGERGAGALSERGSGPSGCGQDVPLCPTGVLDRWVDQNSLHIELGLL